MFRVTPEAIIIGIIVMFLLKLFADVAFHTAHKEESNTEDKVLADNIMDVPQELPERPGSHTQFEDNPSPTSADTPVKSKRYPVLTEVVAQTTEVERQAARHLETSVPSYYGDEETNAARGASKAITPAVVAPVVMESAAIEVPAVLNQKYHEDPPSSMFGPMDFNMDNARDIVAFDRS